MKYGFPKKVQSYGIHRKMWSNCFIFTTFRQLEYIVYILREKERRKEQKLWWFLQKFFVIYLSCSSRFSFLILFFVPRYFNTVNVSDSSCCSCCLLLLKHFLLLLITKYTLYIITLRVLNISCTDDNAASKTHIVCFEAKRKNP